MENVGNIEAPAATVDNSNAQTSGEESTPAIPAQTSTSTPGGWQSLLSTDVKGFLAPKEFPDTPEGLNKAITSYANLEKLIGHEKVPIPKGPEDAEGWNRFSKAMGIPDKAEGYGLKDAELPEALKGAVVDKSRFAEIAHAHKLTPAQAEGLWKTYNEATISDYNKAVENHQKSIQDMVSALKGEWGDAFETNVELGQLVINKFSTDQEMNDYITAVLSQDPRGIKFLARVGSQFAENKVGEFAMKNFSLAPEEAQNEIDKMVRDLDGPYMNRSGKFTEREHQAAVDRVNHLRTSINRAKG